MVLGGDAAGGDVEDEGLEAPPATRPRGVRPAVPPPLSTPHRWARTSGCGTSGGRARPCAPCPRHRWRVPQALRTVGPMRASLLVRRLDPMTVSGRPCLPPQGGGRAPPRSDGVQARVAVKPASSRMVMGGRRPSARDSTGEPPCSPIPRMSGVAIVQVSWSMSAGATIRPWREAAAERGRGVDGDLLSSNAAAERRIMDGSPDPVRTLVPARPHRLADEGLEPLAGGRLRRHCRRCSRRGHLARRRRSPGTDRSSPGAGPYRDRPWTGRSKRCAGTRPASRGSSTSTTPGRPCRHRSSSTRSSPT